MNTDELSVKITDHINNDLIRMGAVENRVSLIEHDMKNKVSYKMFYWTAGVLLTLLTSLLGYMTIKIDNIQVQTFATGKDVAKIQGVFQNYSFEIKH